MNQKGTRSLFVTLETNGKYENFNYMVHRWSYDVLLINENNLQINLRLANENQTPICISVISITHCTDFLTFPLLFLPILFHLHIQYLLFHQHRFGENYIHVACNVFTAKNDCVTITIAFTEQPYNWTLLHIFFNDSGHRCRTAIFLNTSELLNATCVQNHSNTLENNRTYLKNDSKWFFF